MNQNRAKKVIVTAVGLLAGNIAILGYYPFGISYMTSGYMRNIYRYLLFPVILISMAVSAQPIQVAKYGISMTAVIIIISLIERGKRKCPVWTGASAAGVTICMMQVLDYFLMSKSLYMLIQGLAEGVMVISLTVIFSKLMEDFLEEKQEELEEESPVTIVYHPGKEKIEETAKAFRNLANTFYGLPSKKEALSKEDIEEMVQEVADELCCTCNGYTECWNDNYADTYKITYDIWNVVEQNGNFVTEDMKSRLDRRCIRSSVFLDETMHIFKRAKLNLIWNNRLIENREAVADQLNEMAGIMRGVAEEVYDAPKTEESLEGKLKRRLKLLHVSVQKVLVLDRKERGQEIHITMKTNGNRCIATKEVEKAVSGVCKNRMVSSKDSRSIVNKEFCTIIFINDVSFKTLYGVARATKGEESISGDNFSFLETHDGHMVMSLSDGMGSGINAYKESAQVIDLLEQFLDAGFKKETAVKMINSSLVMRGDHPYFSTIDISSIDLYSGVCDFLKIGASTTFIRRDNWVETISSTSLPVGVFYQMDTESVSKKLYDGDFVIMVTDGILDALPIENQEVLIQEIIMDIETANPKKMASSIMKSVLEFTGGEAKDDMTVLVTGVWKK